MKKQLQLINQILIKTVCYDFLSLFNKSKKELKGINGYLGGLL